MRAETFSNAEAACVREGAFLGGIDLRTLCLAPPPLPPTGAAADPAYDRAYRAEQAAIAASYDPGPRALPSYREPADLLLGDGWRL